MSMGRNRYVRPVKVPMAQCLIDVGVDVLDSPARRKLSGFVTVDINNRSQQ
jgi:hypothetical protein